MSKKYRPRHARQEYPQYPTAVPQPFYAPPPLPQPFPAQRNVTVQALQDKNASVVAVDFRRVSDWTAAPDYQFTATGSAKREQGDRFDPLTGELLAASRAFERLARQLRSEAEKRVAAQEAEKGAQLARIRDEQLRKAKPPVRRRTKEEWEILKRHQQGVLSKVDEFLNDPSLVTFSGTPAHYLEQSLAAGTMPTPDVVSELKRAFPGSDTASGDGGGGAGYSAAEFANWASSNPQAGGGGGGGAVSSNTVTGCGGGGAVPWRPWEKPEHQAPEPASAEFAAWVTNAPPGTFGNVTFPPSGIELSGGRRLFVENGWVCVHDGKYTVTQIVEA